MTSGRITFAGNPWPLGHRLDELTMTLRGGKGDELRLHLHLESAPYDAEGPGRPGRGDSPHGWDSPSHWKSHRSAILSSTKWHNRGIPVPVDDGLAFDELDLSGTWTADPEEKFDPAAVMEERAFGAYVLGTCAVAGHEVTLDRTGPNQFDLRWTGRLAALWSGQRDLTHDFEVVARGVRLS